MDKEHTIRIKDIAELAGCSIGTVDRVIHKRGKVSENVKSRILEIMDELDYRPNLNARVLAQKQPMSLGILLPEYRKGEYWELPHAGIRDALARYNKQGFRILVHRKTYSGPEEFLAAGMSLIKDGVQGVIMNPASFQESVRLVRTYFQQNIPFVFIDSDISGTPSLSFIGKDPVQSGRTAGKLVHQVTRHIEGKKKVWLLNVSKKLSQMYALLARENGFTSYYYEKGLQEDYAFSTFEIEDKGKQAEFDKRIRELIRQECPHAIYVTGSRVNKVALALKKLNLPRKPLLIGHDLTEENRQRVLDESIDFIIEEEARRQGYLAAETMIRSVVLKETIERKQWMNLIIYTQENLPSTPVE
jgi:LacI family transcriptional regulator